MNLLFIDVDCPRPLDGSSLDREPLGGTESTLFRIAEGLSGTGRYRVAIAQHNREETLEMNGVGYVPFRVGEPSVPDPDVIVVLRSFKTLNGLRKIFPGSRMFLWMHCFPGSRWKKAGPMLERCATTAICVSDFLRERMRDVLGEKLPMVTIYNPVVVRAEAAETDVDKLVFFSSPHKGLEEVLRRFSEIRSEFPAMRLYLGDPGYWGGPVPDDVPGVVRLGHLPPKEIHAEVSTALCVFYPQRNFEETFGLVFAEANALGVPVLAHGIGAAVEVLEKGGQGQVVNCTPRNVLETIRLWRAGGRPVVREAPEFSIARVLAEWEELFKTNKTGV